MIVNADKTVALDKQSGEIVWTSSPLQAVYSTPLPFVLGETPCVAIFGQQALSLLELASGAELCSFPWQEDPRVVCAASPVAVGRRLFVSSSYDHGCALVEFADGRASAVWASKEMRSKMAGCILVDGHLYGFDESLLECLDLQGGLRWRVRGLGNGALSGGDGKLAILSSRGELVVAEATPEAFRELSRVDLFDEGVFWTPPVIAGGFLLCRSNRGALVCRDHRGVEAPAPAASESAEALPEPEELFARHLARIGGAEALRRHRSRRFTGTFEMRSQGYVPVPLQIDWLTPDRKRVQHRDSPPRRSTLERVFDGELLWEVDPLGARLLPEERLREAREAGDLHLDPEPLARYVSLRSAGVVSFDQRPCQRVDAVTRDGKRRSLFFSVETGLLAGHEGESEAIAMFDDYREFEGVLLPTLQRFFASDTGIEELFRIERVEFDVVDPSVFARPPAIRPPGEQALPGSGDQD